MLMNRGQFLSRFLYHLRGEEFYWATGSPPTPERIEKASAAATDTLGFVAHQAHFTALAQILDICNEEELGARGGGQAARNATMHPLVAGLKGEERATRAGIAAAAVQGLVWMEECRPWVQDYSLRNQIAKRVMTAVIVTNCTLKDVHSEANLSALVRLGRDLKDRDKFVDRARGGVAEILAAHITRLPRDAESRETLRQLLAQAAHYPPRPVEKAIQKLTPLTEEQPGT